MPEIFFPSPTLSTQQLFGKDTPTIAGLARNNALACNEFTANMPYCLADKGAHPESRMITLTLSSLPEAPRNHLMCTIDTFGDFTPTLAAFYDKHLAFLNLQNTGSLLGAGATASEVRLTGFQKALINYQNALMALHKHKGVGRGPSATRADLKSKARLAYNELQTRYHAELNKLASPNSLGKNRGNALSGADRGITLAQRRGRGINVANNAQATQIATLAKGISYAGKGMVALDAGIRVNHVHNTYQQGGNWQREAAIQATGFGLGGIAGIKVTGAVITGLTTIGLGLTPIGWVVLIGVGVTAGFTAAYAADTWGKNFTANLWDR